MVAACQALLTWLKKYEIVSLWGLYPTIISDLDLGIGSSITLSDK